MVPRARYGRPNEDREDVDGNGLERFDGGRSTTCYVSCGVGRLMPVVSVNLSDNAYEVYRMWRDHGRSASQKVSQAICRLWDGEDGPVLQPGDRRTSVTGDKIVWTEDGWKVEEDNSNEVWMKKQKELNE